MNAMSIPDTAPNWNILRTGVRLQLAVVWHRNQMFYAAGFGAGLKGGGCLKPYQSWCDSLHDFLTNMAAPGNRLEIVTDGNPAAREAILKALFFYWDDLPFVVERFKRITRDDLCRGLGICNVCERRNGAAGLIDAVANAYRIQLHSHEVNLAWAMALWHRCFIQGNRPLVQRSCTLHTHAQPHLRLVKKRGRPNSGQIGGDSTE